MAKWYEEAVFYQIYPLGLCGAPPANDGIEVNRIKEVAGWVPHLAALHIDAVYFCPVFESDAHGYDTRDYQKIDCRLGSNRDFAAVCRALHDAGIKVVLDGVFNHVGRGFFAFRDVQQFREASQYRDWFFIDFNGGGEDGFSYEGWEGYKNLVRLNLRNPAVQAYLFDCIKGWISEFDIDGLRLDVAYMLDEDYMRALRALTDTLKADFYLVGEIMDGDYNRIANDHMLHSATNYECFAGIHSSLNDINMFEIAHSLKRQYGPENWALYKRLTLLNFLDNHDVNRIASLLNDEAHLPLAYTLLFTIPGIPCIYYGSEWGVRGTRHDGSDADVRPFFPAPQWTGLTDYIAALAALRHTCPALSHGAYRELYLTNPQLIFERADDTQRVIIALNAGREAATLPLDLSGRWEIFADAAVIENEHALFLPPCSAQILIKKES